MADIWEELGIAPMGAAPADMEGPAKGDVWKELGIAPMPMAAPPPPPESADDLLPDKDNVEPIVGRKTNLLDEVAKNIWDSVRLPVGVETGIHLGALRGLSGVTKGVAESQSALAQPVLPKEERTPTQDRALYRAGTAIDDFASSFNPLLAAAKLPKVVNDMSRGLGTTGMIGVMSWTNPWMGALTGSLIGRDEAFQDALENGADEDAAILASNYGAALGLTEAIPFEMAFSVVARNPAGKALLRKLREVLPPGWAEKALKGVELFGVGLSEGLQEIFQQAGLNLTASDFVGYDPDRPWHETLALSGAHGFGQGVIIDAFAQMLGMKRGIKLTPQGEIIETPSPAELEQWVNSAPDPEKIIGVTTRLLESLPTEDKQETINVKAVTRLFGKAGLSELERNLVDKLRATPGVLDENGHFKVRELRQAAQEIIIPLTVQPGTVAANYGLERMYANRAPDVNQNFLAQWAVPQLEALRDELLVKLGKDKTLHTPEEQANIIPGDTPLAQGFWDTDMSGIPEESRSPRLSPNNQHSLAKVLERTGYLSREVPATYGEMLGLLNDLLVDDRLPRQGLYVFNAPFKTEIRDVQHYPGHDTFLTQNYVGHVRMGQFESPDIQYEWELQADLLQKRPKKTTQERNEPYLQQTQDVIRERTALNDRAQALYEEGKQLGPLANVRAYIEKAKVAYPELLAEVNPNFANVGQVLNSLVEYINENNRTMEEEARFSADMQKEATQNTRLREAAEQAALNRMRQRSIKMAAQMGAKVYRFPTLQTMAMLQHWQVREPASGIQEPSVDEVANAIDRLANRNYNVIIDEETVPRMYRVYDLDATEIHYAGDLPGDLQTAFDTLLLANRTHAAAPPSTRYAETMDPTELFLVDPKQIGFFKNGEWVQPSTKQKRMMNSAKFIFDTYKKYHGKRALDDMIIMDKDGYGWYELPLTEGIVSELEYAWSFPGPIAQQLSDGFDSFSRAIFGENGRGGLLRNFGILREYEPEMRSDLDSYNKWIRQTYGLTQLAFTNKHIRPLQDYVELVRQYWNKKTEWSSRASNRMAEVFDLSINQQTRLWSFALDVTVKSEELGRRLTPEELVEINGYRNNQLNEDTMAVWERIDQDFRSALEAFEETAVAERRRAFRDRPVALRAALEELQAEIAKLKNKHYFPLTRFGDYYVTVKTLRRTRIRGRIYNPGDVIEFWTFEGIGAEQKQARKARSLRHRIQSGEITIAQGKFEEKGAYFDTVSTRIQTLLEQKLELEPEQRDLLAELIIKSSPSTSYLRHMTERKAITGFSEDALRAYAQYFSKFSNFIARETFKGAFNDAFAQMRQEIKRIEEARGVANKRTDILNHMKRHLEYLFDPGDEAASFRAAAFIWYIGFLPKSAVVNFTQPVVMAYPYLARTYGKVGVGDIKALYNISKSYIDLAGDSTAALFGRTIQDATQGLMQPDRIEPWLSEFISRGCKENFLEESYATEMGAVAEGTLLSRMVAPTATGRLVRTVSGSAAYMFQQVERLSRRVTFMAACRLERARYGADIAWEELTPEQRERVYKAGRTAVESTMFEYARWNRPELMRGATKSTIFVFQQFTLGSLHFATRYPGRGRYLLMLLALAGWEGLPLMEDILSLLKAALNSTTMRKAFGLSSTPMIDLKQMVREYLADLLGPDTADLVMHGLGSRYGLGPLHLLDLFGLAMPNMDISGSMSMGKVVPGLPKFLERIAMGADFNTAFSEAIEDVGGAAWAMPLMVLKALASDDPNLARKLLNASPKISQAIGRNLMARWEGQYTTQRGDFVMELDVTSPEQNLENMFAMGGFLPSDLRITREANWTAAEHMAFYKSRKQILLNDYAYYYLVSPDAKQRDMVMEQITKYNSNAPPPLVIKQATIRDKLRDTAKKQALRKMQLPTEKRLSREYKEIRSSYPEINR